jgi:PBP1b-binding outer membrane lipoprotein LpoB
MKKSIVSIFMSIFLMFIFSGCVQKMERAPIAEDKLAKEFCKNRSKPDNDARVRPDAKTEFNRTVKRCSTGH